MYDSVEDIEGELDLWKGLVDTAEREQHVDEDYREALPEWRELVSKLQGLLKQAEAIRDFRSNMKHM